MSVIWHDLECGSYAEDLTLWRSLARTHGDPILDVGAGTGRVALDLARRGHEVVALDRDPILLAELDRRSDGLGLATAVADARSFELGRSFALCLVPMQTIQLLGGPLERSAFLTCAKRHLRPGAVLAMAIAESLDPFEVRDGGPAPMPDMCELDGIVYSSAPTAIRVQSNGFVLERRRESVGAEGGRYSECNRIRLERLAAAELEREAIAVGLMPQARERIRQTEEYVGSAVVMLRA